MSINHSRRESRMFQMISEIIANLKNVNIVSATVTGVKLSKGNSHLKVFVTFLNSKIKSFETLNKIKGTVRTQLASSMGGKFVPSMVFVMDEATEKGNRIDAILKELKDDGDL